MKNTKTIGILMVLLAGTGLVGNVEGAAPAFSSNTFPDIAGVEVNRTVDYLERERVARQIAEDQAKRQEKIKDTVTQQEEKKDDNVSFEVKQIITDQSAVLNNAEIKKLTDSYVGRKIFVKDLYELIGKINKLYSDKGYMTCRAGLPPQTVKQGIVHIRLVEGKTGNISVTGNNSTKQSYITNRLHLHTGEIANVNTLNDDLLLFNGTNDVQLRVKLKAGEKPYTTDYEISTYEPKRIAWTLYSDNAGSTNSGEYRYGLFFTDRSLTGNRDPLTLSTMMSQGMKSFSGMYSHALGNRGTKLNFMYSTNSVHITDGDLEPLDVHGHANSYTLGITHPLVVNETTRVEAGLDYNYQNSQTDFLGIHWLDDTEKDITASVAVTNYGNSHIFYQKHSYTTGDYHSLNDDSSNYGLYKFNGLYQKTYQHGQMISARMDAQWGSNHYLPSARQFYIGGAYSVRGYNENLLSGDSGYSFNVEYSVPLRTKKASAFIFYDQGAVYGDSAFEDHVLNSFGIGVKGTIANRVYASLSVGWPFRKDLNGTSVDSSRLHFMINSTF